MNINWLLYAPQYHFCMAVVAVACLVMLVRINRKLK